MTTFLNTFVYFNFLIFVYLLGFIEPVYVILGFVLNGVHFKDYLLIWKQVEVGLASISCVNWDIEFGKVKSVVSDI